jgi:hypothetical protein
LDQRKQKKQEDRQNFIMRRFRIVGLLLVTKSSRVRWAVATRGIQKVWAILEYFRCMIGNTAEA